jgi:bacterioferritin-associated ferredoxin
LIVCLCKGLCEKKLGKVIDEGASTVREVGRRCGAGTDCGSCRRQIAELIGARSEAPRGGPVAALVRLIGERSEVLRGGCAAALARSIGDRTQEEPEPCYVLASLVEA